MNSIRLEVGKQVIQVYGLSASRSVSVCKVVCRGRHIWAVNAEGRVYCSALPDLRPRGRHRLHPSSALQLSEDDIFALGQLGLIDAKETAKLKEGEQYRRDYQHKREWLMSDIDSVREAGIALARNWKAKVETMSHTYAKQRAKAKPAGGM